MMIPAAKAIEIVERDWPFRYLSAEHWLDVFRAYYGPVHKAFAALDAPRQADLRRDLLGMLDRFDRGAGNGLVALGRYAEVVITR